ncbi:MULTISPECIES: hypothetical protein [unclassified Rhodanobacter]|uniref:hypothetical protein n=1 Tax=unclassified Rhodanobacter TaxID=2621553 RepID=UPI001BE060A9|nr:MULTISPECIES: hypothetical protein [unclassified Rhodanobacter]MBT2144894.1 hypothetical protein [Rhodanobacter sp. LX-99]MBT2148939.1 hypothetical protein [Rhodanobacter sp. LX-100]
MHKIVAVFGVFLLSLSANSHAQQDDLQEKCTKVGGYVSKAASIRLDTSTTNEEKIVELMQEGLTVNQAMSFLNYVTMRPTDSSGLLQKVAVDHCLKNDFEGIDTDTRLHPVDGGARP